MKRVFIENQDGKKVVIEYKNENQIKPTITPTEELIPEIKVEDNLPELESIPVSTPAPPVEVIPVVIIAPTVKAVSEITPTTEPVHEVPVAPPTIEIPEPKPAEEKVMVSMGETGSNCFDECESKDAVLTPVKEQIDYGESDISVVAYNKPAVGVHISPPNSMVSLLD